MITEREPLTVVVDPENELGRALATARERRIVVVSNGDRFSVTRETSAPENERDASAFLEALRAAAGTFTPEEGEQLKQNIYRWREEGSRPDNPR